MVVVAVAVVVCRLKSWRGGSQLAQFRRASVRLGADKLQYCSRNWPSSNLEEPPLVGLVRRFRRRRRRLADHLIRQDGHLARDTLQLARKWPAKCERVLVQMQISPISIKRAPMESRPARSGGRDDVHIAPFARGGSASRHRSRSCLESFAHDDFWAPAKLVWLAPANIHVIIMIVIFISMKTQTVARLKLRCSPASSMASRLHLATRLSDLFLALASSSKPLVRPTGNRVGQIGIAAGEQVRVSL